MRKNRSPTTGGKAKSHSFLKRNVFGPRSLKGITHFGFLEASNHSRTHRSEVHSNKRSIRLAHSTAILRRDHFATATSNKFTPDTERVARETCRSNRRRLFRLFPSEAVPIRDFLSTCTAAVFINRKSRVAGGRGVTGADAICGNSMGRRSSTDKLSNESALEHEQPLYVSVTRASKLYSLQLPQIANILYTSIELPYRIYCAFEGRPKKIHISSISPRYVPYRP